MFVQVRNPTKASCKPLSLGEVPNACRGSKFLADLLNWRRRVIFNQPPRPCCVLPTGE